MATNTDLCRICSLRHLSNPSKVWCPDCEQALCADCQEHHSLSKASSSHNTIPIGQYQKFPSFVSEIQQYCPEHKEKYNLICQSHDTLLCSICIKEHSLCGDVLSLKEILENAEKSNLQVELSQKLSDLKANINKIREDRQNNIATISNKKKSSVSEIRYVRLQIEKSLNKLEEKAIAELEEVAKNTHERIQGILSIVDDTDEAIAKCLKTVENISHYASDLQAFLVMRKIEQIVNKNENLLRQIVSGDSLDEIDISFSVDRNLKDFLLYMDKFGLVEITRRKNSFVFKETRCKQAQIMTMISIDNIKIEFVKKIKTGGKCIRGCHVTSEGKILLTDHQNSSIKQQLLVKNADGSADFSVSLAPFCAFDVTLIDDVTAAVTSGISTRHGINILDMKKRRVTKVISVPRCPYGITCNGRTLICSVEDDDLYMISCTDFSISKIPNTSSPPFTYVTSHADKVYFTNRLQKSLICSKFDGTPVWKFENEALKTSHAINVDVIGNVFLVSQEYSSVFVVSSDGKKHKQILTKDNGLAKPKALFFDKSKSRLLVVNSSNGSAFIFDITFSR